MRRVVTEDTPCVENVTLKNNIHYALLVSHVTFLLHLLLFSLKTTESVNWVILYDLQVFKYHQIPVMLSEKNVISQMLHVWYIYLHLP